AIPSGPDEEVKDCEAAEQLGPGGAADNGPGADGGSRQHRYASGQYFFEYLVVVSLKKTRDGSSYEPQITYQFPKRDGMAKFQKEEEEKTLKALTLFCFPEGISWAPLTEYHSETFSFVLTEVDGSRRNGYCRRLLILGRGRSGGRSPWRVIYPFMQKLGRLRSRPGEHRGIKSSFLSGVRDPKKPP
ncbi:hypothetical protein FQN60_002153, partial [Etheostoma spectabile]